MRHALRGRVRERGVGKASHEVLGGLLPPTPLSSSARRPQEAGLLGKDKYQQEPRAAGCRQSAPRLGRRGFQWLRAPPQQSSATADQSRTGLHPNPPPTQPEKFYLPGMMTSGNPNFLVIANPLLNIMGFSLRICSMSPRRS